MGLSQTQLTDLQQKRDAAKTAGDALDVAINALTPDDDLVAQLATANGKITALTNAIAAIDAAEGDVPAAVAAAKQAAGL